jgi:hypothetical protein
MEMTANGSATSRELGRPHPEARAPKRFHELERACARLEDLILRSGRSPRLEG